MFMCRVGNDFLPHLPSLDIRDGGLDVLLELYAAILPKFDE
jgi:5'-3' exoribonuclease 2